MVCTRPECGHAWQVVTIPGGFRELGVPATPAVCYFRKTVVLPDPLPTGTARDSPGHHRTMDTTHINGHWVGASAWVENPRAYDIANGILKPGTKHRGRACLEDETRRRVSIPARAAQAGPG